MIGIIKFFGVLSIIVAVILILVSFATVYWLPTLLPLGGSLLLGGALLIAFARVVELLEELNEKLEPVNKIARALAQKYDQAAFDVSDQAGSTEKFDPNNPIINPFANLPSGSRLERHFLKRVAFLPDGSVIGDTDDGVTRFQSFEAWRRAIGK